MATNKGPATPPGSWSSTRARWPGSAPAPGHGERFLEQCAPVLARPEAHVTHRLHVYTFDQVAETEAWRRSYLDQLRR